MLTLCVVKGMDPLDVTEDHLGIRGQFVVIPPALEVLLGLYVCPIDMVVQCAPVKKLFIAVISPVAM